MFRVLVPVILVLGLGPALAHPDGGTGDTGFKDAPSRLSTPPRLSFALARLWWTHRSGAGEGNWPAWTRAPHLSPAPPGHVRVVVELVPGDDPHPFLDRLDVRLPEAVPEHWVPGRGGGRGAVALVQVTVPAADLAALARMEGIQRVRRPYRAGPLAAETVTEARSMLFARDWYGEGLTGNRVKVAVLDVGFAGYEGLLGSELPRNVDLSVRSAISASSHGTAVAEVIHDLAPEASLHLLTFNTDVEFISALEELAGSGPHLVNGSVGFDNIWPADGTSPVTEAVDALVEETDALYLAAAGNENDRYKIGPLEDQGGWVALDGDVAIPVATAGGWVDVSFRWDDPMGASANDLDLYVYDDAGNTCGSSQDVQDGDDDPYESVSCFAGGSWAEARVFLASGSAEGLEGYLYAWYGLEEADWAGERNLTLPGDTRRGLSVGAVDVESPDEVTWYSSRGPTEDGRIKPDLVAPSGVSTTTYGTAAFTGTSAATPHATGVLALAMEAGRRRLTAEELREWARENTVDVEAVGEDTWSGTGRLYADEIPWRECGCHASPGGPARLLPLLALLPALRRRKSHAGSGTGYRKAGERPAPPGPARPPFVRRFRVLAPLRYSLLAGRPHRPPVPAARGPDAVDPRPDGGDGGMRGLAGRGLLRGPHRSRHRRVRGRRRGGGDPLRHRGQRAGGNRGGR